MDSITKNKQGGRQSPWSLGMYALSVACIVAVWQIAAVLIHAPLILPPPVAVFTRLVALGQTAAFWLHVAATFARVLKSFVLVCLVGSALGIASGLCKPFARFVAIPLAVIRATPVVSFILIALFWLGTDNVPVFCAVLMALPVMITVVSTGFARLDTKLLEMARVFCFSRRQIFRYIYVDQMSAFFVSGALSSFGMIWKVVAAGEVLSVPRRALGSLMQGAQVHLETADVLALSIALVVLSVLAEQLTRLMLRACVRRRVKPVAVSADDGAAFAVAENGLSAPQEIAVTDFSLAFDEKKIYDHFSLHVPAGECVALLAPSGAGKTTLLRQIAREAGARVSYAFQEPRLLAHCTVLQNIALPLENRMEKNAARIRAAWFLRAVGLQARSDAFPDQLSGGERQRVALARALSFPSGVLLLDEAFQSQDVHIKIALRNLLQRVLSDEPRTVLFVTHDVHAALQTASRLVVLAGVPVRVVLDAPAASLSEDAVVAALRAEPTGF